ALSRVRTVQGLSLSHPLQQRSVLAHPEVVRFYAALGEKGRGQREQREEGQRRNGNSNSSVDDPEVVF
ncbi:hypothetical protein B484DRAFT_408068, partial [Ochromonadaceae sp. CCMP2298]